MLINLALTRPHPHPHPNPHPHPLLSLVVDSSAKVAAADQGKNSNLNVREGKFESGTRVSVTSRAHAGKGLRKLSTDFEFSVINKLLKK